MKNKKDTYSSSDLSAPKRVQNEVVMNDDLFLDLMLSAQSNALQKLLDANPYTEKFGLHLSEKDALQLYESKKNLLKENERLELGESILPKLIFSFCDSPHIYQDNYIDTIDALMDLFYRYKSECLDELTDDELITFMKDHFDGECEGSLDYLEENCLEKFCRNIREGYNPFLPQEDSDD